ncbi:MAG: 3-hydroxy-5-phosphonooxypentane-2,4-dione thiolase [Clostridia bacterium]
MADAVGNKMAKDYHLDREAVTHGFHVKGMGHAGWGMKNRLAKMFDKESGNTVILAFDHGYIMGATAGLERLDITMEPLLPYVDVIMGTRGAIRSCIDPAMDKAVCLRATHDSTVLFDEMSQGNGFGLDMEDAIRMNASCIAMQCFVGGAGEATSLENLCRAVDAGEKYNVPVMAVTAVGKEMVRNNKYFMLATRVLAELGAHTIKTYYCEDFEKIVAACPVPIVIAGGKKVPEKEAFETAYAAMQSGARGVDMGRNIFQSECPEAVAATIGKIVHENMNATHAYEFFQDMKNSLGK